MQARELAFEAANALKKPRIVLDLETLFSTQEIDDMAYLIRDYGRDAVLEGIIRGHQPPKVESYGTGWLRFGWSWFEPAIAAARDVRTATHRTPPPASRRQAAAVTPNSTLKLHDGRRYT